MRNYRAETIALYIKSYKTNIFGLSMFGLFVLFLITVGVINNVIIWTVFWSVVEGMFIILIWWNIHRIKNRKIEMAKVLLLSWKWE